MKIKTKYNPYDYIDYGKKPNGGPVLILAITVVLICVLYLLNK